MNSDDSEWLVVLNDFLQRWHSARAAGADCDVEAYVAMWPRYAEPLRSEHAALLAAADGESPERELRIGHYLVERELGRGGQAVVYLARDERLQRAVALKVLPRLGATVEQELRLQREATVAARLEDPGICPVYEVGRDGEYAFLAMRYVAGETLAARLERARGGHPAPGQAVPIPWRQVVAWFVAMADSLHRAHEAGVVHRDLKPGNIMLASDGRPVLLDFGLATGDSDGVLTRTGDVFGTPAYVAPERLSHRPGPVDRRVHIWSLGVCLYESLTLVRPFAGTSVAAICRAVAVDEVPDPRKVQPTLPQDLAAVVAVALEKDPSRRYQTAVSFADDLRAVLAGEPVLARPPGWSRRLGRWHRRHATLATGVWMAAVAVVALFWLQRSMLTEVSATRDEAQGLNDFLIEKLLLAGTPDEARGKEPTAGQVLVAAARNVETQFAAPSRVAGMLQHVLGRAHARLGRRADAERHFERAAAIRAEVLGTTARATLQSRFELCREWRRADGFDRADRELRLVLSTQEQQFGATDPDVLRSRLEFSELLLARGSPKEAESEARVVVDHFRSGRAEDGDLRIDAEHWLARCLVAQGRRSEAEPLLRGTLAARRRVHGEDSASVVKSLTDLASLLHDRAIFDREIDKWAEATSLWEEAGVIYDELLATVGRVYPKEHPVRATTLNNVASFAQDRAYATADGPQRDTLLARAESYFREGLQLREVLDGPDSVRVARACSNLGNLLVQAKRGAEAEPYLQRAVAVLEKRLGPEHVDTINGLNCLAFCRRAADGDAAALPLFAECLRRGRAKPDRDPKWLFLLEESWIITLIGSPEGDTALPAIESFYPRVVQARGAASKLATTLAAHAASILQGRQRHDEARVWEGRAAQR
jgi:tetratricopeptide (TPR) repeat protein